MTDGHRTAPFLRALLVAGLTAGAAFAGAGTATADPMTPTPIPVPSDPAAVPPGQPVSVPVDPAAVAAPAPPPPNMTPSVPEIANPTYGSQNTPGVLGSLKDMWHQVKDPYYGPQDEAYAGGSVAPPPGQAPRRRCRPGSSRTPHPAQRRPRASTARVSRRRPGPPPCRPGTTH